ncbi:unnamed protein product [Bursaphelenchus okinawaensis]|uniref:SXP/RAL-2 family protein Ani s 5-like cation-binding domain-containing protein n=1 Tax=Bursaphelenchus okinawaensis TaxID=465554 RepID=A0A811K7U2_9BILA|nr:unnamed protein product [Bursaphelenchus okinawaensis]CAG9093387.1 unnamed protein product [Bursaphelenchus okinawaensis]
MHSSTLVLCAFLGFVAYSQAQEIPPPPFLMGESPAVLQSFQKILEQGNHMTDDQLDREVEKWVQTQSASVKSKYATFKSDLAKHQSQAESAHKAAVAKFSGPAKEADAKLSAIANNPALTSAQKNQQIEQLVSQLPPAVRKEIEDAMQG